jgi:hypothetical protein
LFSAEKASAERNDFLSASFLAELAKIKMAVFVFSVFYFEKEYAPLLLKAQNI